MSRTKHKNEDREQKKMFDEEHDDAACEGPGPPAVSESAAVDPTPVPEVLMPEEGIPIDTVIDHWVEGLRDDLDEIVAALLSSDTQEDQEVEKTEESEIEDWTVKKICNELENGRFKNIVVFTGAGISTSAGIPDFRTPGSGLYDNLQEYDLNEPEDIFDLGFFKENPKPFYRLAKEIMPGKFAPTIAHHFIAMLEEKGILSQYFTQNIDGLDKLAGISDEKMVQVHGTFDSNNCASCKESVNHDLVIEAMKEGEPLQCPHCTINGETSWIKPDITFFGESMPDKYFQVVNSDGLENCDLLIIIGTSLKVSPANFIPTFVPQSCPRLLINREAAQPANFKWRTDEERIFDSLQHEEEIKSRDAFIKLDACAGCLVLADALNIKNELGERFVEKI